MKCCGHEPVLIDGSVVHSVWLVVMLYHLLSRLSFQKWIKILRTEMHLNYRN